VANRMREAGEAMSFLTNPEPERPEGRHPDDFYATPRWCTESMLGSSAPPSDAGLILEPSCGDGAILDLLREWSPTPVVGYDIDPGRLNEARRRGHDAILADFLSLGGLLETVWIVGNPPFSLAQEFVEHALRIAPPGSRVTFLLRLAFLSSQGRAHLYSGSAGFRHLGVLGRRPSFTPGGGTDSSDYGWFTWEVGHRGPSMVDRLDSRRRMDND
jgi:hypothetical protein